MRATVVLTLQLMMVGTFINRSSGQDEISPAEIRPNAGQELSGQELSGQELFAVRIFPLFKTKCFPCHGDTADDIKGELDMRTRHSMLKGGESGKPLVVPGHPRQGQLLNAVEWVDLEMPPKENDRLNKRQVAEIRRWIEQGAAWPQPKQRSEILADYRQRSADKGIRIATSGGTDQLWTDRTYNPQEVWAFRPIEKVDLKENSMDPIDELINRRHSQQGLTAVGRAHPATLIRRATFDLTGLGPTPQETAVFNHSWEENPDQAYEDLIERLLESPRYGERSAQHWLDVVRYADTAGFSNDYERSNAWRYRDYVVRAFNNDKPFNRFLIEQIAGDELPQATIESKIAVSFLRMGPWGTAMIPQEEIRQILRDDIVHSVGQTFLAMPMRCSKCHDHKFDPVPTRDYYRMMSIFAGTQPAEIPVPFLDVENKNGFSENKILVERLLGFAKTKRDELYEKRESAARRWYEDRQLDYVPFNRRRKLSEGQKPARFVGLSPEEQGQLKVREQDVWIWERRLERFQPLVQGVYNGPDLRLNARKLRKPEKLNRNWLPTSFILDGGVLAAPGSPVFPGVLSGTGIPAWKEINNLEAPSGSQQPDRYRIPNQLNGRRLALARWMVHQDHPLTSRVIVNRIWQQHFGAGIVSTPNNFGVKGEKPSHPELLDWLAIDFMKNGWKIKRLHRQIMRSQAYQRSAIMDVQSEAQRQEIERVDPENRLLTRFNSRRLTAEEIRDNMLLVTGELEFEMGGVPVFPEINMEVALQPRMIQFSIAPAYQPSRLPKDRHRRTLYAYRVRGMPNPFLEVLNRPNPNESCGMREAATVSPQALTMMNSHSMMDRSIALALRLNRERKTLSQQVERGFELAFSRVPTQSQLEKMKRYVLKMDRYHQDHQPEKELYPTSITRSLVEELTGQPFEYEEILPVFEDYQADKKPSEVSSRIRALADFCLLLFNSNEFSYVY